MNKIIKCLEENNIKYTKAVNNKLLIIKIGDYTIEVLKDGKFFIAQKYKYGEKCSPEIKKDLNYITKCTAGTAGINACDRKVKLITF